MIFILGIILTIIFYIVEIIFFVSLYSYQYFKEQKETDKENFIIKSLKPVVAIWFIISSISFAGLVTFNVFAIYYKLEKIGFFVVEVILFIFFALCFYCFLSCRLDKTIIKGNEITIKKILFKTKRTTFEKIKYFNIVCFYFEILKCYDEYGVPLMTISLIQLNSQKFQDILIDKDITELPNPFPYNEFKYLPQNKIYYKKDSCKSGIVTALCISIFLVLMSAVFFAMTNYNEFINLEKSGYLESYQEEKNRLQLKFQNDESIYIVNSIYCDELNQDIFQHLKKDKLVELQIAYIDEKNVYNISGIEIDGQIFLSVEDSQKAEYKNYRTGIITCIVTSCLAASSFITAIVLSVILSHLNKKYKTDTE